MFTLYYLWRETRDQAKKAIEFLWPPDLLERMQAKCDRTARRLEVQRERLMRCRARVERRAQQRADAKARVSALETRLDFQISGCPAAEELIGQLRRAHRDFAESGNRLRASEEEYDVRVVRVRNIALDVFYLRERISRYIAQKNRKSLWA